MGWLDASDYLVMDIATRNRVDELRSTLDMTHAHGRAHGTEPRRTRSLRGCMVSSARALRLILGLIQKDLNGADDRSRCVFSGEHHALAALSCMARQSSSESRSPV
jgi:hypothetical protein